jgi:hypothetical protein
MTGFGAVVNRAKVPALSSVVVIGTGGVGLNALQAAAFSELTLLSLSMWLIPNWKTLKNLEPLPASTPVPLMRQNSQGHHRRTRR